MRTNLGDAQVVSFILHHGIPKLLDVSLHQKATLNRALLKNMLAEVMMWHASLLQNLVERKQLPEMDIARRLSDLNQKQWREQRRQSKLEAKERMQHGAFLVYQRTYKKRKMDQRPLEKQYILT